MATFRDHGYPVLLRIPESRSMAVSCTTGALAQDEMNDASDIHKVGCGPLGQAEQIKAASVDLVAKDRTTVNDPLRAIRNLSIRETLS